MLPTLIRMPFSSPEPTSFDPRRLTWTHRYPSLGEPFAVPCKGQGLTQPRWVALNHSLAADLGWPEDWANHAQALPTLSGSEPWPGMVSVATVYSGHQFGVWAGQLGDGRALLLGELDSPMGPQEIQLKGSGPTPYSRRGDGRAVLRSSIREYLCSEAMHALGVPTTRALALTASDQLVFREDAETAAVVTRVAPSFIRFGHFEHFCHHGDHTALKRLVDFVIAHHYPECADAPVPAAALLEAISRRTAELLAQWQAVGFCHGVMNTDNMSILGLTLDYGPFGFLDAFDPAHICNHSDHQGRYAYARQPQVAFWNLHALAQALVPAAAGQVDALGAAVSAYRDDFGPALGRRMRAKFGLQDAHPDDQALLDDVMRQMAAEGVDYTIFFRRLCRFDEDVAATHALRDLFIDRNAWNAWAERYRQRLAQEGHAPEVVQARRARMRAANPKYILRNHLAEQALRQAQQGDYSEVHRLERLLAHPFDEQPGCEAYAALPPDWAKGLEISCSS